MTALACARGDDRLPMLRAPIDASPLLYQWRNADSTRAIRSIRFSRRDSQVTLQVSTIEQGALVDWGDTPVTLFTDISCPGAGRASAAPVTDGRPTPHYAEISMMDSGPAFTADFDRGGYRIHLQGRLNVGLLLLEVFNEAVDGGDQVSHYHRECLAR